MTVHRSGCEMPAKVITQHDADTIAVARPGPAVKSDYVLVTLSRGFLSNDARRGFDSLRLQ